jgi:hypothetical protein
MKRALAACTVFLLFSLSAVHAAELNAGFVQGLWYGKDDLIANEPTRIYVALRNNTDSDLTGTVRFTDNGARIGIAYVSALPGRIVEAWVDWTPRYGEHTVTASLSDVRAHTVGENPEIAEVENTIAEDTIFVDYDTDGDGIPNEKDTDDDNDDVSDEDENARGTNPLKADPKESETEDESDDKDEEGRDEKDDVTENESESDTDTDTTTRDGLERFVPKGIARNITESVTDTIAETKSSLDDYRDERTDAIRDYMSDDPVVTKDESGNLATITRSQLESEESFIESAIRGGKALLSGLYSLILWMLSSALAHPAILELLLLIFIIYIVYRTARRFGRRRQN